jgi:hypothetical protein
MIWFEQGEWLSTVAVSFLLPLTPNSVSKQPLPLLSCFRPHRIKLVQLSRSQCQLEE